MTTLITLFFDSVIPAIFIAPFIIGFRRIPATRRNAVFAGIGLYGIVFGLLAAFNGNTEGLSLFNWPASWLGGEVNHYWFFRYGDTRSSYGGLAIPWPVRIPQVRPITCRLPEIGRWRRQALVLRKCRRFSRATRR